MDVIYARQSVDKKDSISIQTQIEFCRREVVGEPYKVYQDKGYSGSNLNRPDFQTMLRDIKEGRVRRVIVYRLDRMSRSLLDFANLMDFLDQYHTSFVSTQEKFDTATPMGRAMLSITMVFAQLERETIQIRIKDNYYARGEKGMYLGGPPPYGFEKVEEREQGVRRKYLLPVSEEAEVIRQMYTLYGSALHTLGEVARMLNAQGARSHSGKKWTGSKVSLTLRNPIYVRADVGVYRYYREKGCRMTNQPEQFDGSKGCYLYGRRKGNERKYSTFADHVLSLAPSEGLVDGELFLQCQRRLDGNDQLDNHSWGNITWLTGLVKCGKCGYAVLPKSSHGGRYYYLYCSGRSIDYCDVSTNLGNARSVEQLIEARLFAVVRKYRSLQVETGQLVSREANQLQAQMEHCSNQIERLIDLALQSEETAGQYLNQRIEALDRRKRELEEKLRETEAAAGERVEKQLDSFLEDWPRLNARQKNELARLFIHHISVSREELVIYWKHHF